MIVSRLFPVARAAHIQDDESFPPRPTWCFKWSYDMIEMAPTAGFRRGSLLHLLVILARGKSGPVVEVWEPLWVRFTVHWLLVVWTVRASDLLLRRRRREVVFYAIENNDPGIALFSGRAPQWVVAASLRFLRANLTGCVDRVAFGSDGSKETYSALLSSSGPQWTVIRDLPSGHKAPVSNAPAPTAVFVGTLDERKGIAALMPAWEHCESTPGFRGHLSIVGGGPREEEVAAWAAARPESRRALGWKPRSQAVSTIQLAAVLVAPSVPVGLWREQIGRSILEGLEAGLTIVTTEQTGIAPFLAATGHHVVDSSRLATDLAPAILAALELPLSKEQVVGSLPAVPGRRAADTWLHCVEAR